MSKQKVSTFLGGTSSIVLPVRHYLYFDVKNSYFQETWSQSIVTTDSMKFVVDCMLGKLARWLRILGCDTIYNPSLTLHDLLMISNQRGAVFLTRRKSISDTIASKYVFMINHEQFNEQLREVVDHFKLDVETTLFTRCTKCNIEVLAIEKSQAKGKISERSYMGFNEFFECPSCGSIYWGGSHRNNTLKKLHQILKRDSS